MIYLLNISPAIDKYLEVKDFEIGVTNFTSETSENFAGKAINIMKIVDQYSKNYQLYTLADNNCEQIINNTLSDYNIKTIETDFIRVNLKINNQGEITEINQVNPLLTNEIKNYLQLELTNKITEEDYFVVAGNLQEVDKKFIIELVNSLNTNNIILDISSLTSDDLSKVKPLMIKPNEEEVLNILDTQNTDQTFLINELQNLEIDEVCLTLGEQGAYLIKKDKVFKKDNNEGKVINTVGAGDSFVGGYLIGKINGYSDEKLLELAVACGNATAFDKGIGNKIEIDSFLN